MNQPPKKNRARIDGIAWLVGALVGAGVTTVLVAMEPTGYELKEQYLAEHTEGFEQLRSTLDQMAARAREVPTGTIDSVTNSDQLKELAGAKMDLREPGVESPAPNAAVAQLEDFPADPDPYRTGRSVLQPRTFRMRGPGDSATLVDSISDLHFLSAATLEEFHGRMDNLQYVFLIRFGELLEPKIRAEGFEPGYQTAEAFCFDIHAKRLLGSFSFEATTNDNISFRYSKAGLKEGSALHALGEQLEANLEIAFCKRLHELVPGAVSNMPQELPFSEESLNQARTLFKFRKAQRTRGADPE